MTDMDLIDHLQARTEKIVKEQLSDAWRYKLFAISNKMPNSPDMIVVKRNGENLYLCLQGVDTNTNITLKEADWKESCREFAQQEGITPHFLEVVILDRKGKGNDIFIRGLMELGEKLRLPKERIGSTNKLVWIAAPIPNDMEEAIDLNHEEKKKKLYEEMEAVNKLESERIIEVYLLLTKGKPIDKIPDDSYCYTADIPEDKIEQWKECLRLHGEISEESWALYDEIKIITTCPYREWTDYGTVKCHFLEEEAVGLSDGCEEKALAHFGSEERLEEECQGDSMLADAVRCCNRVVESIREATNQ